VSRTVANPTVEDEHDDEEVAQEAGDGVERRGAVRALPTAGDLATGRCHSEPIAAAVFCPPDILATAGMDGKVLMWSLATGTHFRTVYAPSPGGDVQGWESLAFCPRVRALAAVGDGPDIRMWPIDAAAVWSKFVAFPEENESTAALAQWHASLGTTAGASAGGQIVLPRPFAKGQRRPPLCEIVFDSGGEQLVVARADGWVVCFDVLSRREVSAYVRSQ